MAKSEKVEQSTPPLRLTRRTLLEILKRTQNRQPALDNPHEFAAVKSLVSFIFLFPLVLRIPEF